MIRKFLRQDTSRYSKIGKNRKKLQKWRKPKGRHSKMRNKRKSYPASPSIGYKSSRKEIGKIDNLYPKIVNNLEELNSVTKEHIVILSSKLGAKKKLTLIKRASELNIPIENLSSGVKK